MFFHSFWVSDFGVTVPPLLPRPAQTGEAKLGHFVRKQGYCYSKRLSKFPAPFGSQSEIDGQKAEDKRIEMTMTPPQNTGTNENAAWKFNTSDDRPSSPSAHEDVARTHVSDIVCTQRNRGYADKS